MRVLNLSLGVALCLLCCLDHCAVNGALVDSFCFESSDEFVLFDESIDFPAAKELCVAQGGTLASIRSEAERQAVREFRISLNFQANFWVGVEDKGEIVAEAEDPTRFSFVDGTAANEYLSDPTSTGPWVDGEPNHGSCLTGVSCEDCVEMRHDREDRFNDNGCDKLRAVLCRNDICRTANPTTSPSPSPSKSPSESPTKFPTQSPTKFPSESPTSSPSLFPTDAPTLTPSSAPSLSPSIPASGNLEQTFMLTILGAAALGVVLISAFMFAVLKTKQAAMKSLKQSKSNEIGTVNDGSSLYNSKI